MDMKEEKKRKLAQNLAAVAEESMFNYSRITLKARILSFGGQLIPPR